MRTKRTKSTDANWPGSSRTTKKSKFRLSPIHQIHRLNQTSAAVTVAAVEAARRKRLKFRFQWPLGLSSSQGHRRHDEFSKSRSSSRRTTEATLGRSQLRSSTTRTSRRYLGPGRAFNWSTYRGDLRYIAVPPLQMWVLMRNSQKAKSEKCTKCSFSEALKVKDWNSFKKDPDVATILDKKHEVVLK